MSGATRRPFPHNDIAALEELLTRIRSQFRRVLIVVEGVYSMDGDIPDLPELIRVKKKHGALLMIDEAHSIGVLGATGGGIGEYFGVDRADVDLWMGTLSKAFASCGGYIGGSHAVIDYLKYTLPGFVYSAGMTPANAAASLAAIRQMRAEPERLVRLHQRALLFHRLADQAGIDTGGSAGTPVIPCVVGDSPALCPAGQRVVRARYQRLPDSVPGCRRGTGPVAVFHHERAHTRADHAHGGRPRRGTRSPRNRSSGDDIVR
ncbi:aminotransferase class I/II-fold pyridoxal phosphate-dependent enzyme [Kibdelosporangium aridum]|uniref:aminotransferase class I/II-fold pyridoxal phosphate-dependent enzyme n=1 Tax=Kibdelosporangium aridum TaxID=2030 RepID=UPI0035EAC322